VRHTGRAITAVLDNAALSVEPGQSVVGDVRLRNDGLERTQLVVAITGPARPYSWVAPDTVEVTPGSAETVRVGFRVPRASVPAAGPLSFEVTVTPAGETAPVATAAGVVEIRPFSALSVALAPPEKADDGHSVRHGLVVGNRGNAPVKTALRAEAAGIDLEVRVEPSDVLVAPGDKSQATVEVAASKRLLTGKPRTLPFRVVAQPEVGEPAEAEGQLQQQPVVTGRTVGVAGAIVGAVALIAGVLAFTSRSSSDSARRVDNPADAFAAQLDACPATGHTDAYGIRGLDPAEIDKLPNAYAFLRVKADGCSPVRFNPCEPVHYIQNAAAAPPEVVADVHEAFRRLSRATGITFVDDGFTDETVRTGPYVPDRYGPRWAPILILWEHFPPEQTSGERQVLGQTTPYREGDVIVSGRLRFNVDAYNDEATKTPIRYGFGPEPGTGSGAIGRNAISWGRIVLHELAHVAGLGHTRDKGSLMYPDAAQQTVRPADFAPPDLLGLRYLGKEAGCLTTPPVPRS
jgi:hypothetical protein